MSGIDENRTGVSEDQKLWTMTRQQKRRVLDMDLEPHPLLR